MRTTSRPPHPREAQDVTARMQTREAGLRVARRVRYWVASAAVAVAGGLAAVTAHAYHARAASLHAAGVPARQRPADDRAPSAGSTSPAALQPPAAPPSPAPAAPVAPVVSGGS